MGECDDKGSLSITSLTESFEAYTIVLVKIINPEVWNSLIYYQEFSHCF